MRALVAMLVLLAAWLTAAVALAAGRIVAAGPPANVLVHALAPERMLGWVRQPSAGERAFLPAATRDLPEIGRLTGRAGTVSLERLVAEGADLIVDVGSTGPTYRSLAERVEAQTGIRYLLLDGSLAATPATIRALGRALAATDRAEALAAYAEETFALVDALPRGLVSAYLARGPEGLETGTQGSINTEILERAGAVNVAVQPGRQAITAVSLEQVLAWNPAVIITLDPRFPARAAADPLWRAVAAVRGGRVHVAPALPFGWIDSPPGINRLIGLRWLAAILHPGLVRIDMRAEARRFYRLAYHLDLDEAALDRLLGG
ncbi:MAG: iron ABC transporter substrate-binding protein [Thalassobaculales bacterium]